MTREPAGQQGRVVPAGRARGQVERARHELGQSEVNQRLPPDKPRHPQERRRSQQEHQPGEPGALDARAAHAIGHERQDDGRPRDRRQYRADPS